MRKILSGFRRAILVHFVMDEGRKWPSLRKIMGALERAVFLDGFERAWALSCGPCELCDRCTMDVCAHPKLARPSMEACGIDVFSTAKRAGLPIEVVRSKEDTVHLYCLLLVD